MVIIIGAGRTQEGRKETTAKIILMETEEYKAILRKLKSMRGEKLEKEVQRFCRTLEWYEMHDFSNIDLTGSHFQAAVAPLVHYYRDRADRAVADAVLHFSDAVPNAWQVEQKLKDEGADIFFFEDIKDTYPRLIKKLQTTLAAVRSIDTDAKFKNVRMKDGEEIILFFERKLRRRNRRFIIGKSEAGKTIGIDYAYLWNMDRYNEGFEWEAEAAYLIKCNGLYKKRKRDVGYYTFDVAKIEE